MKEEELKKVTASIKEQYPDIGIRSIEVNDNTGQATFYVEPTKKSLAFLDPNKGGIMPRTARESAAVISRDFVNRQNLDLIGKDAYTEDPKESFKRAIRYYYVDPLVGTTTNILANLARKGFENDIDDNNIKQFYDVWTQDVGFDEVLEWIYLDFFKVGHVTTYKAISKYEPRVSYLSPVPGQKIKTAKSNTEHAAKKKVWSKGYLPIAYTVLNPLLVNVTGNLMFDKVSITLTPPPELKELLNKKSSDLTDDEAALIKALSAELKEAAQNGKEYPLDPGLVGQITYRKQPYERYAKPRATRIFESIEYKNSLKQADLSTLDGITNYILKITIGNDEYPVVTQSELEAIAKVFDTPSKSFDVVWNHTLQVEKIVSPEIDKILGQGKYNQVNDDMLVGLAISRAIIDGGGDVNAAAIELVTKGLMEEINYARRQVTRWVYKEYEQIATAMGFDRYPKIRWDDGVLIDTILYLNSLAQCVDRRMLSYRTALEALGFDYPNELKNMQEELPLVEDGLFGLVGSPWQKATPTPGGGGTASPVPSGTPSSGPPKNQVKQKDLTPKTVKKSDVSPNQKKKNKLVKQAASIDEDTIKEMTASEYAIFLDGAKETLSEEEYGEFLDGMGRIRYAN